jgi:hypothetical protein
MKKSLLFLLIIINGQLSIVNCYAQWVPEINITPGSPSAGMNENAGPCLAVSGTTLHVVHTEHRSLGWAIYNQQSLDSGNTWMPPVPVTDTLGKASMPVIAAEAVALHVVWMDSLNGIRCSYYKRSLDNGQTWSANVLLDSNTAFWPGVAVSGQLVVITLNKRLTPTNTEVFIMISNDGGATWGAEQQISNADGRSEDPAIAVIGQQVHLSWNDKRSGTMLIYYRHSLDGGSTWGPEMPLTTSDSYTSMVSVNGANVDVPCGKTVATKFHVFIAQSVDSGVSFAPELEVTFDTLGDAYPYLVRNGLDLYMGFIRFANGGPKYIHSGDGGATWDSSFSFGNGSQPFVAYTGCALHAVYTDSNHVSYRRNPNGNCAATSIPEYDYLSLVSLYPNPFTNELRITWNKGEGRKKALSLFDITGKEILRRETSKEEIILNTENLAPGFYLLRVGGENYKVVKSQ